ncbi:copper ion binding protein [Paenibacillus thermoaerophilus]|uniref:Copper ion binding protein n=1 Tax=Paenibacillus thermoaerophilus TaxID=1215385 RepID=A0ABW2V4E0_9BACL|nr:copper ion binding protein [Paenibacillus thermoaerophilus]TMV11009.1 heavy-metal-associated domain-containing protein [Paenibacillus thermoaerophilus]
MQKTVLNVEGMSCQHCVRSIEDAMKEIGATGIVDLANKTVTVTYDESKLTLEQVKEAIEEQGYDVRS